MNNKVKVALVAVLVIIATWVGVSYPKTPEDISVERVVNEVKSKLDFGAVSTLDGVDNGATKIGGVEVNYVEVNIVATSSTICSIPVPENATSTVLAWSVNITDGILGANNMSLSTSTNGYATSTSFFILDRAVASNVGDSFSWQAFASTTGSGGRMVKSLATGESPYFLLPGERLNLRLATTTGAGVLDDYYDGVCRAVFLKR